jgi:hypothetical protein
VKAPGLQAAELMSKVVGIDLGYDQQPCRLCRRAAARSSFVTITATHSCRRSSRSARTAPSYVGREGQRRLLTAPSRSVYSVKRFMGPRHRGRRARGRAAAVLGLGRSRGVVRIRYRRPRIHARRKSPRLSFAS